MTINSLRKTTLYSGQESKRKIKCCKECISSSWAVHLHRINSSSNHGTCKLSAWEIEVLKISQGCNTSPSWCVTEMKWVVSCSIDDWHQTRRKKEENKWDAGFEKLLPRLLWKSLHKEVCSLLEACITPITGMRVSACPRSHEASAESHNMPKKPWGECMHAQSLSRVRLFFDPMNYSPPGFSMRFSRQEY